MRLERGALFILSNLFIPLLCGLTSGSSSTAADVDEPRPFGRVNPEGFLELLMLLRRRSDDVPQRQFCTTGAFAFGDGKQ
jgi:hypothetical protein